MNPNRKLPRRLATTVAAFALILSACSTPAANSTTAPTGSTGASPSAAAAASKAPCGTVNVAVNPWVGYEADAAVVSYVLQHQLGCTVVKKNIDEQTSWQGFPTGEVDAILENWGHENLVAKYITADKTAQDAGQTGNEGIIGWYIPKFFADANPDILTTKTNPQILNKYADQFKTSESGGKGQILDGDPSFVTQDQGMINAFGLNFKVVYSGSEAASNKAIQSAIDQKKPILAYYYTPNWFSAKVDLVHLEFPPYTPGCDKDITKVACDYPPYHLNKIVSTKFATSGSPAYTLIKNFKWTNDDQNQVAADITGKMSDDDAAKKWLDANPDKWKAWLPG
ncbi:MAG: ABC transporter substrate-binding protein [Chloroflexota bacterium]|nr:ABC transporter substrate-binding protein [Chloroflexota bacterium]